MISSVYRFHGTPAGVCVVFMTAAPAGAWTRLTYLVHIPGLVEPIGDGRPANVTGRAGALYLLGYIAEQLGMVELSNWARYIGPFQKTA